MEPVVEVDRTLPDAVARYRQDVHPDAVLDVHLPRARGTRDLVVLVHGGFWKQHYDRRHTRPLARALADAGFAVVTPEYRRVGGGGGWPTTSYDVLAAVRAAPPLLEALGVRPSRTLLVGHSAGGQLVLWLSGEVTCDGVVALAPVADLREADRRGLGSSAVRAFMGTEPATSPEAWIAADPTLSLAATCRVLLLHGEYDDTVPVDQSERLVAAHPEVQLRRLPIGHYEFLEPSGLAFDALLEALEA